MVSAVDVAPAKVGSELAVRLDKYDFAEAVAWAARTLPSRPTDPVLAGVRITARTGVVTIAAFDGEVSGEVEISGDVASPGAVLVSGRLVSEISCASSAIPRPMAVPI